MRELGGKVAVVTGGGSGIGRGMALAFADAGMKVVVADIELPAAEKVAAEIAARGARALAVHTDVTRRASVEELAERVTLLKTEISRLEEAATKKRASRDAANSFFKS